MLLNIVLSIVGFALLIKSADFFVDGAASFAKNFKISTTVIGLTIVAFGTSAPELAISFSSHLSGNTDMLFGNVFGSNIANIFVILGIAVVIKPIKIRNEVIHKEIPILLLITLAAAILFLDSPFYGTETNSLSRTDGIIMFLFFSVFIYYLIRLLLAKTADENPDAAAKYKLLPAIGAIAGGLVGIIAGSELVVNNVAAFAESVGVSQKIISVTIISIGTSLPELVTIITAARKGENNMAIGSIVGSNIFNICIVIGLPVIVLGEAATTAFGVLDMVFLVLSVIVLWIFSATNRRLKRYEGAALIALYCVYVGYIFL